MEFFMSHITLFSIKRTGNKNDPFESLIKTWRMVAPPKTVTLNKRQFIASLYNIPDRRTKNKELSLASNKEKSSGPIIAVVDKKVMGQGNDELGELLLKSFLGALKDSTPKPEALYCYNGGVYLGVEEPYKKLLQELRDAGIKIFFCGTCVKFYELEGIKVEEQTNMLGIIEAMSNASAVIRA